MNARYATAVGTMLVLLGCIGIGRFSLGVIAPIMEKSLAFDSLQIGLLATTQNVFYLLFAWIGGRQVSMMGGFRRQIAISMPLCGAFTFFSGLAPNFSILLVMQSLVGVFSGIATVSSYGLMFRHFASQETGKGIGITNSGPGLGLLLTGVAEPFLSGSFGLDQGWRFSYFSYGLMIVLIALVSLFVFLRRTTKAEDEGKDKIVNTLSAPAIVQSNGQSPSSVAGNRKILYVGLIYFIFGLDYIIYVTYFPSFVSNELGYGIGVAGNALRITGILAALSGILLGVISDKIGRMRAFSLGFLTIGLSSVVLLIFESLVAGVYVSAFLFGIFVFGMPAVAVISAGELAPRAREAEAVGFVTLFFGVGQVIGPVLAGYISNLQNSLSGDFVLSVILSLAGLVASLIGFLYQRK